MPELVRKFSRLFDAARNRRGRSERRPRARVVCVASGKGGTGKSIVATNLAVLRSLKGERVLLADFDAGFANAHLLLGLAPQYDLGHVLSGDVTAEQAAVTGPGGISLLCGGVGRYALADPSRQQLDRLFRALEPLEERFDLIVIDLGAGLSYTSSVHLAAAQAVILVTHHESTALSDAYALYKRTLFSNPEIRAGLFLNRIPDSERASAAWERLRGASERFLGRAPEYLGWALDDQAVPRSVEERRPVSLSEPDSPAATAFLRLSTWAPIDQAHNGVSFYDRARSTLR